LTCFFTTTIELGCIAYCHAVDDFVARAAALGYNRELSLYELMMSDYQPEDAIIALQNCPSRPLDARETLFGSYCE
jgi:hypothetical protein